MKPNEWVPVRWPSGPLETALRKDLEAAEKDALAAWHRPESLKLLDGTPFNCIVVTFAGGRDQDAEQQRTLEPLIQAARSKNIAVIGRVPAAQVENIAAAAKSAGLDALLSDGAANETAGFPVFASAAPAEAGKAQSAVVAVTGCEWPSVRMGRNGAAASGPTGYPWVDSNGWISLLARAEEPNKQIWTTAEPKRTGAPVRAEIYALAVADSAAYGTRWLATLDPLTQAGLTQGDSTAREAWSTLVKAVRFFEDHKAWRQGQTLARLGIVSDFAGPNQALAQEVLNLTVRRQLPSRVIDPGKLTSAALQGLNAVVSIEQKAPSEKEMRTLDTFLSAGGVLIVPASAAYLADGHPAAGTHDTGYKMFAAGKGKIAVAPKPWTDPYALATDAHRLLSRKHDVIRLWNAGSSIASPVLVEGGAVVHVLNYTGRPVGYPMSLYIALPFKRAQYSDLFGKSSALEIKRSGEGTEVSLPPFTSYAAVEFGEKA
jgi:hypothetical protein